MSNSTTASDTISWQTNEGRGTWDIISSCVLTLALCVWTALHLNVPKQNATLWDRFKTKTIWVVAGIFAPELVVYIAWVQYSSAKYMLQTIQSLGADGTDFSKKKGNSGGFKHDNEVQAPSLPSTATKHKWTMSHCYYAGMGGFAFDSDQDNGGQEFLPGSPSLRFTSHAILMLAKLDKLPNLSSAEISDKSKADGLAKTLVCLQATWMLAQSVGRLAAGLPVTLLEVNTIGHCVCSLIIYLIWWNKPLQVLEPSTLSGDWMRGFTSYAYMRSQMHKETIGDVSDLWNHRKKKYQNTQVFGTEMGRLAYVVWENRRGSQDFKPFPSIVLTSDHNDFTTGPLDGYKTRSDNYTTVFPSNGLIFSEGEIIPGLNFIIRAPAVDQLSLIIHKGTHPFAAIPEDINRFYSDRKFVIKLTRSDFVRWKMASEFINSARGVVPKIVPTNSFENDEKIDDYVATNVSNYPFSKQYATDDNFYVGFVLTAASAAYGGLHLGSWNSYFPTVVERWLWMSSSISIALAGCIPSAFLLIATVFFYFHAFVERQYPKFWKWCGEMVGSSFIWRFVKWIMNSTFGTVALGCGFLSIGAFIFVACLVYCFTRAFIVVEAFISLRQLPLAYYDTPVWSNMIPHL